MNRWVWVIIFSLCSVQAMAGTVCNAGGCVITVDWALDNQPGSNLHTCDYNQGAATFIAAPDGKCTLRRALREAGARSDGSFCPNCTPITIRFTGLNGSNGDADDQQFNPATGQWVLPIDSSASSSFFGLKPQSVTDVDGPVTVEGFTIDVPLGQMPKIMIDSGKTLDIQLSEVTLRNLGFMGGMSIHWKEANGLFTNNTWGLRPDGMDIQFDDLAGNADNLAGNHAILTTNKADGMVVTLNVMTGASTYAVEINSATTGVEITSNLIGTRIDGTVPVVPAELWCRTFTSINPVSPPLQAGEWFGGAGISAAGFGLLIDDNVIAGLQTIHSTFSTPPEALTVFGRQHIITNNQIGRDFSGREVGVCGQGLKLSTQRSTPQVNNGHLITDNRIYRPKKGFDNTKGAILWSDTHVNGFRDGGNTIRRNEVHTGLQKYIEFGPLLMSVQKTFEPAVVTFINGNQVSGHAHTSNVFGDPSPCPNCIIDFYLDDGDEHLEALQWLGSLNADASGNFSGQLAVAVPTGFGVRTTSTTTANDVIPETWAGTTSEMSSEVYGLENDVIFTHAFDYAPTTQ